jgi:site-specific DNA recombinase
MIAAVYARKSTDQNLPDEEKSVTRQVERATAYALRKGWQVGADYVYQDDGISGAEFKKRPGLVRLMAALEPRPPFGVLIMSEESRLGREQVEAAWLLKQITEAGVRVFFYLEDRERTLDSAMDKVMLSLSTFAAEMEREKARQRTYDAMHRKASRGHVAGGIVYGYVNHRLADHVERRIVPAEAEIVRRIFQLTADGAGLVRIARTLTAEQVPPPRRLRPHGRPGWAPSAIRDMLRRDLYRGRIVWNKTQRVDRKGTRTKKRRPAAEWLQLDAPELRIVDDPLWKAAHAVLTRKAATYLRLASGQLLGRPEGTRESPYLLTGISQCAACEGSIFGVFKTRQRHAYYGCLYHKTRGPLGCANSLLIPMLEADALVLDALGRDVLQPACLTRYLDVVFAAAQAEAVPAAERRRALQADLQTVETEIAKLEGDLASGAPWSLIAEPIAAASSAGPTCRSRSRSARPWRRSRRCARARRCARWPRTSSTGRARSPDSLRRGGRFSRSSCRAGWCSRRSRMRTGGATRSTVRRATGAWLRG